MDKNFTPKNWRLDLDRLFDSFSRRGERPVSPEMTEAFETFQKLIRMTVEEVQDGIRLSANNPAYSLDSRSRHLLTMSLNGYLSGEFEKGTNFDPAWMPVRSVSPAFPKDGRGVLHVDLDPTPPSSLGIEQGASPEDILGRVLSRLQSRVGVKYGDHAALFFSDGVMRDLIAEELRKAKIETLPIKPEDLDPEGLGMALDNARGGGTYHVFSREMDAGEYEEGEMFVLDGSYGGDDAKKLAEQYVQGMQRGGRAVVLLTTFQLFLAADLESEPDEDETPGPER